MVNPCRSLVAEPRQVAHIVRPLRHEDTKKERNGMNNTIRML